MASVKLQGVHKTYPNGLHVLRNLELEVAQGELMVLVGPSGSGKSTALRIVAGLESPSEGAVYIVETDVTEWDPQQRDIAMVFQSYALYPHMTVRDNIAFGMRMRAVPQAERTRRTQEIAERLSIAALLDRKPAQLSGGQRQRVALGRALVRNPKVFLLDEPLSNLDAKLRAEMRAEIARLHAAFGVTTMYVTHDQEEAMTLGDRMAVMGEGGRLEQLATPLEVYNRPKNAFVAEFIGMPRINWFTGELEGGVFTCPDFVLALPAALQLRHRGAVRIGVRPHDLALVDPGAAPMRVQAELVEALGASLLVHGKSQYGVAVRMLVAADSGVRRGDTIGASPNSGAIHVFAEAGDRIS
jgi:ABC-type sugar transport system ATPase subunit